MADETKKAKKQNPIAAILSGSLLTQDTVVKHLPYLLFLAFLGLVYIANGYMAESSVRKINRMQQEIKELRSEQISMKSELNNTIIESELKKIIGEREMGLTESIDPPKKIVLESSELEDIN
ncbi:MAG: FtsL-like putative cell division protein [Flavobacteriales bacterium]